MRHSNLVDKAARWGGLDQNEWKCSQLMRNRQEKGPKLKGTPTSLLDLSVPIDCLPSSCRVSIAYVQAWPIRICMPCLSVLEREERRDGTQDARIACALVTLKFETNDGLSASTPTPGLIDVQRFFQFQHQTFEFQSDSHNLCPAFPLFPTTNMACRHILVSQACCVCVVRTDADSIDLLTFPVKKPSHLYVRGWSWTS